jgi:hypothetical protein
MWECRYSSTILKTCALDGIEVVRFTPYRFTLGVRAPGAHCILVEWDQKPSGRYEEKNLLSLPRIEPRLKVAHPIP